MLNPAQQQSIAGMGRRGAAPRGVKREMWHASDQPGLEFSNDDDLADYTHAGSQKAALDRLGTGRGTMFRMSLNDRNMDNSFDRPVSDEFANTATGTPDEGNFNDRDHKTYDDEVHLSWDREPQGLYYVNAAEDKGSISAVARPSNYEVEETFDVINQSYTVEERENEQVTTWEGTHPDGSRKRTSPNSMSQGRLFPVTPRPFQTHNITEMSKRRRG